MVTETEAREYVQSIETRWYGQPSPIIKIEPSRDLFGDQALDVQTQKNAWTVWLEPTGEVYGEC